MTSQSIFEFDDLFGGICKYMDGVNRYHSIIHGAYYGFEISEYRFKIEDFICYYFGTLMKKITVTNFDPVKMKISYDKKEKITLTEWDVNFLFSLILKTIFMKKPITSRQFKCLQKIKYGNIDDRYKVSIDEDKLDIKIKETTFKKKEVRFLSNNTVGIRYDYDENVIRTVMKIFENGISYVPKLEMNIVPFNVVSKLKLQNLENLGFDIDKRIYDFLDLRGEPFYGFEEKNGIISVVDNKNFTTNLIKTLLKTGNLK